MATETAHEQIKKLDSNYIGVGYWRTEIQSIANRKVENKKGYSSLHLATGSDCAHVHGAAQYNVLFSVPLSLAR